MAEIAGGESSAQVQELMSKVHTPSLSKYSLRSTQYTFVDVNGHTQRTSRAPRECSAALESDDAVYECPVDNFVAACPLRPRHGPVVQVVVVSRRRILPHCCASKLFPTARIRGSTTGPCRNTLLFYCQQERSFVFEERLEAAGQLRQWGNECFKRGQLDDAAKAYERYCTAPHAHAC